MDMNRRKFLKLGTAAVAGLGVAAATANPAVAAAVNGTYKESAGKRSNVTWGMVIDMNKMDEATLNKCIEACHKYHNVPNIDTKKANIGSEKTNIDIVNSDVKATLSIRTIEHIKKLKAIFAF